ncbi:hypothetical protein U0070_012949 [Myodes glareolus]|uniref:Uncharacterized protein n=1 Tax=Myodes glareolus TaxID=447135 RepID=A0AAW0JHG3_MYOGA
MESPGRRGFQVQLVTKDSGALQEKQVPRETGVLKVPEEFLDPLGRKETRVYLGFLVRKAWLAKRASKGLQERWDLEDPGVSLDLVGALAFLACLGPLDFLE